MILGDKDTSARSITTAFTDPTRYIGVTIAGSPEIKPRQQILSAPYALGVKWGWGRAMTRTLQHLTERLVCRDGLQPMTRVWPHPAETELQWITLPTRGTYLMISNYYFVTSGLANRCRVAGVE